MFTCVLIIRVQLVNPQICSLAWDSVLYEMRVKIHQFWIFAFRVNHANEIKCFEVHATCDTTTRFEMKSLFDAFKILWLNVIETKSDWN